MDLSSRPLKEPRAGYEGRHEWRGPNMKKLLSLVVVCLFVSPTAMTLSGSLDRVGDEGIREQFVGAWRLAWLEAEGVHGKIHRADSTLAVGLHTRRPHVSAGDGTQPSGTNPCWA